MSASSRILAWLSVAVGAGAVGWAAYDWPGARAERTVAAFVASRAAPDDVVVVTPAGSLDRLRAYTQAGLLAVSEQSDAVVARSGFARAWLVGALGTQAPPPVATGGRILERHQLADTSVWLVSREDERASTPAELAALLKGAVITTRPRLDPTATDRPCPREGERFRCGPEGWQWIGLETVTVQGERRACIWAHPIAADVLSIELPALARMARFRLVTLLSDGAVQRTTGSPIDVLVITRQVTLPSPPLPTKMVIPAGKHKRSIAASGQNTINALNVLGRTVDGGPAPAVAVSAAAHPPEQLLARLSHGLRESQLRRELVVPPDTAAVRLEVSAAQDGAAHFCFDVRELR